MSQSRRPRVLIFSAYYWPGYKAGGPIRSVTSFVSAFADRYEIFVITQDRDARDLKPYAGILASRWIDVRGAKIWYLSPGVLRAWTMWRIIREVDPDIVMLNSFFSFSFSFLPRLLMTALPADARSVWVLHPRGEFAPSALAIKPLRKSIGIWISTLIGRYELDFHISSNHEAVDLVRVLAPAPGRIHVAMNLAEFCDDKHPKTPSAFDMQTLRFVFLSRISPVKNLELVLRAVFKVSRPCILDIYGPISDKDYARRCVDLAAMAPPHVTVRWQGQVPNDKVRELLAGYHFLVFPTLGENFGHVIIEALAAGLPVIISDRTPWRDLEILGAGWVRSIDNPVHFESAVASASKLDFSEWLEMSARARARAKTFAFSDEVRCANQSMLMRLADKAFS